MKITVWGTIFIAGLSVAACGGVATGNGTNSNRAIATNRAGPSTGTAQPNINTAATTTPASGYSSTDANGNTNAAPANNANVANRAPK